MKAQLLSNFTPSLMPPEALESIFVQRERFAHRLIHLIRDSVASSAKQQTLLIGPRGIGKTHLVALIYHRVRASSDLEPLLRVAWLREEEWGVGSFLELLLRIFRALNAEYKDAIDIATIDALYTMSPRAAEETAIQLIKTHLAGRTLLLLIENLDDLFLGLGDKGQKHFRSFLQENPILTMLATSQRLFAGVSRQVSPFYGFFRINHLKGLEFTEVIELLTKVAQLRGDKQLEGFITSPSGRARVRAVHHLAGGNHRVYLIFSQFLNRESLDELIQPFMKMLDELTPYYQARMAWLSIQQRRIVEFLCDQRGAVPVKLIAQRGFMTHQTASGQLRELREMGYVNASPVGRGSYYELAEPLMRLCIEVKKNRGEPIRLFIDFLRLWYSPTELEKRLTLLKPDWELERQYLLSALRDVQENPRDPRVSACMKDLKTAVKSKRLPKAVSIAQEVVAIRSDGYSYTLLGMLLGASGRGEEALDAFDKAIKLEPSNRSAWFARGVVLSERGRRSEALHDLDVSLESPSPFRVLALGMKSRLLRLEGRHNEAIDSAETVLKAEPRNATALVEKGLSLMALDRHEEATPLLDAALKVDPNNAQILLNQALLFVTSGNVNKALEALERAIKIEPIAAALHVKAAILFLLGRNREAITVVEEVLLLSPEDSDVLTLQGAMLRIDKDYAGALDSYERALRITPQSAEASFGRAAVICVLDWPRGVIALDAAIMNQHDAFEEIAESAKDILVDMKGAKTSWPEKIRCLSEIFERQNRLPVLATAIVRAIPAHVHEPDFGQWLSVWKEISNGREDLSLAIRLLEASFRYIGEEDERALLELPVEERELLRKVLEEDKDRRAESSISVESKD